MPFPALRITTVALAGLTLLAQTIPTPRADRLRTDLDYLASDALAGRASLSPGAEQAARYIAEQFRLAGLRPANGDSYCQPFSVVAYRPDPASRKLVLHRNGATHAFAAGTDFAVSFYRDVALQAPAVFAGYGITAPEYGYDDYANIDVKGKIVVLFDHEPQENDRRSVFNGTGNTWHGMRWVKVTNAQRHGAVAVLIASEPHRTHPGLIGAAPRTADRTSARATAPPQALDGAVTIPAFSISDSTLAELLGGTGRTPGQWQEAIDERLQPASQALRGITIELGYRNAETHRGESCNVAGLLEGSDPTLKSETVLLTAHYDHLGKQNGRVYPGANDNASGTAAVMELARLFAGSRERPKRSLLFVVFGSEEQLMLGSFYYTAHPLRALATTRGVLNLDMIGRDEAQIPQSEGVLEIPSDTRNEINLVGGAYSPDLLRAIREANQTVGLQLDTKHDREHTLNTLFRCDHVPFLIAGVPAVWLFGGFHPGYHEPSDTVEKLNFPKMEKVIRLAYGTAWRLGNGAP